MKPGPMTLVSHPRLLLGLLLLLVGTPAQGGRVFLHAGPELPGEAQDANHKDWIEVLSFRQPLTRILRAGTTGTRAEAGAVRIVKRPDRASPGLLHAAAHGTVLPVVTLEFAQSNGPGHRYFRVALSNVVLTAHQTELADPGSGPGPVEHLTLAYSAAAWTYTELGADGEPARDHRLAWDFLRDAGSADTERLRFRVRSLRRAGGFLGIQWQAESGRRYQILRPESWDDGSRLQLVAEVEAGEAGERIVEVPATGDLDFFLVRELE